MTRALLPGTPGAVGLLLVLEDSLESSSLKLIIVFIDFLCLEQNVLERSVSLCSVYHHLQCINIFLRVSFLENSQELSIRAKDGIFVFQAGSPFYPTLFLGNI